MRRGMIFSFAIANPALRTRKVPKLNFGLSDAQFHETHLLDPRAHSANLDR
jgi:hypothetical protein